ncbi:SH3 domain-containing protein [Treponema sp.]|uniref:SH3 domain-containing protein n=1 Tax=Treponema sp. TaxID=166 RepID=UPI0025D2FC0D|nr:SH3 domain-containing protein [Treponema sp.]MCR5218673.1 SH3 domain-containing protein [Treponema sp.]
MTRKSLFLFCILFISLPLFSYGFYDYEEEEEENVYVDDYGFSDDEDFGSVIKEKEGTEAAESSEENLNNPDWGLQPSYWEHPQLTYEDYSFATEKTYAARVTEKKVNIRSGPSTSTKKKSVVHKDDVLYVRGFDQELQNVDGPGYWLLVSEAERSDPIGWIYSKYLDIDHNLYPGRFSFVKTQTDSKGNLSLLLKLSRCYGDTSYVDVILWKNAGQDFYTFTWGPVNPEFKYYDVPGTFIWNPENNSIKHVSYTGGGYDSLWVTFTDDMEYLLQDAGRSSTARLLNIYETATDTLIFSGNYYKDIFLDGKTLVVAEIYNSWNIGNGYISKESIKKAEEFKNQLSYENRDKGEILVRYKLNLDTLKMEYINCILSVAQ